MLENMKNGKPLCLDFNFYRTGASIRFFWQNLEAYKVFDNGNFLKKLLLLIFFL